MKKLIFLPLIFSALMLNAQQWGGSTTTSNLIYRPGQVLVGGTTLTGSFASQQGVIQIQSPLNEYGLLTFRNGSNNTNTMDMVFNNSIGGYININNASFHISTSTVERFRISANGDIGIGTNVPTTRLEINSSVANTSGLKFTQLLSSSAPSIYNGRSLSVDATGNVILTPAGWSLTGNAGTNPAANYIGTSDNLPLIFRVFAIQAGRLDPAPTLLSTFYGVRAGNSNTTGQFNTAIGGDALSLNTTGNVNVAVGLNALRNNTSGVGNTAVGVSALITNINGTSNSAFGSGALDLNNTGFNNTAAGQSALFNNNSGANNVSIGMSTMLTNTTGSNNTALGFQANVGGANFTNATAVGNGALVNATNWVRIGNATVTRIEGQVGFTGISDSRFKFNINENDVKGLEFINRLRPVVYNFDTKKFQEFLTKNMADSIRKEYLDKTDFEPSTAIRQSGFIAQEVEKAAHEVGYSFNGVNAPVTKDDYYGLTYSQFVVPLVKAVQELSKQNEELKKEIDELKVLINGNINGSIKITDLNTGAKLFQNTPNPFHKSTTIRYTVPSTAKKAVITITSSGGIKMKEFDVKNNLGRSVEINGGELSAGTYIYSLIVEGTLIDSKQMILTY